MNTPAIDNKRRALGKGLDSLLPRVPAVAPPNTVESEGGKPLEIPIEYLDRNPFQTRTQMNEEQLGELAASIAAHGPHQHRLHHPIGRWTLSAYCRGKALARLAIGGKEDNPSDSAPGLRRAGDGNHHRREFTTR